MRTGREKPAGRKISRHLPALLCCAPCAAFASVATDPSAMTVALHRYYDAESLPLPYLAAACLMAMLSAVLLAKRSNRFGKGFAAALFLFSAVIGIGALVYLFQIGETHAAAAATLADDPLHFREVEMLHLADMLQGFSTVIATDIACAAIGAAMLLYGALRNRRFLKGLGAGVLACSLLLIAMENANRRRALDYLQALREFNPQLRSLPSIDRKPSLPSLTI